MNTHQWYMMGLRSIQPPNTFIGGVSATISTPALLATKLGVLESRITNFSVIGSDIQCNITGSYAMPINCFSGDVNITYYKDNDGLVTSLGDNAFLNTVKIKDIFFTSVTNIGINVINGSNIANISLPNLINAPQYSFQYASFLENVYIPTATLGATSGANNVFTGSTIPYLYVLPSLQTNNGGAPDGDISALTSQGTIVAYVNSLIAPNPVTDLSYGSYFNNAIQLNFTAPSSTTPIRYYQVFANNELKGIVYNSGEFLDFLTKNTSYTISIKVVDNFYNISSLSNIITRTTTNTTYSTPIENYKSRVMADGGIIVRDDFLDSEYTKITANSLESYLLLWHNYKSGLKIKSYTTAVEKMYSFSGLNTDISQSTVAVMPVYSNGVFSNNVSKLLGKTFSTAITDKTFSIVFRVKATPTNYYPELNISGANGFLFQSSSNGSIYTGITGALRFNLASGNFLTNTDATYSFTYNSVTKIAKIYRNTTLLGTQTMVDPINFANINLIVGKGTFYDLKMFSKDLTLTEITNIL